MGGGLETEEDDFSFDWEDGSIPFENSVSSTHSNDHSRAVSFEFEVHSGSGEKKPIRRATAEEKELAENVHKVHLLCLVARGRLIDNACDDPLIQASLLSLLPAHLVKILEVAILTAVDLAPVVSWFHQTFLVGRRSGAGLPVSRALTHAIEAREGTSEEVAAISVALFRALNFTTRFVSIFDVASLKPGIRKSVTLDHDEPGADNGIFNSSTLMVPETKLTPRSQLKATEESISEPFIARKNGGSPCRIRKQGSGLVEASARSTPPTTKKDKVLLVGSTEDAKRKGDVEFEAQMAIAISATSFDPQEIGLIGNEQVPRCSSSFYRPGKRTRTDESQISSREMSTAVGSRKAGPPLHWAEVFCGGENLTGKWVHVDTANLILDGEQNVEVAVSACRKHLRYVVAFAGHGAKDVTRRYCMKWHRISSLRVSSSWWDRVLEPLKQLESGATTDCLKFGRKAGEGMDEENMKIPTIESSVQESQCGYASSRSELEDLEFVTRELTEPLPTSQQAYRTHKLYVLEKWLTKYQMLYPSSPILGFCSGHPVYPRSSVETLKTKECWFREGIQIKSEELPAKVLKQQAKLKKDGEDYGKGEHDEGPTIELYGKWQTEELCLPPAVNGVVPKNERGRVDVWCEKCLPPGTVHLRLPSPHITSVARRLGVDFASAMVGFDFQNGRSFPVFDGIVVCAEFKDALLEAYREEEEGRMEAEKKKAEAGAVSRWYQLLSSMMTRQRLNHSYGGGGTRLHPTSPSVAVRGSPVRPPELQSDEHEHVFSPENETLDGDSSMVTKRCPCGFFILVEEL